MLAEQVTCRRYKGLEKNKLEPQNRQTFSFVRRRCFLGVFLPWCNTEACSAFLLFCYNPIRNKFICIIFCCNIQRDLSKNHSILTVIKTQTINNFIHTPGQRLTKHISLKGLWLWHLTYDFHIQIDSIIVYIKDYVRIFFNDKRDCIGISCLFCFPLGGCK